MESAHFPKTSVPATASTVSPKITAAIRTSVFLNSAIFSSVQRFVSVVRYGRITKLATI